MEEETTNLIKMNQIKHSLKNRGFTKHYGNYDYQMKAQNFNKKKKNSQGSKRNVTPAAQHKDIGRLVLDPWY